MAGDLSSLDCFIDTIVELEFITSLERFTRPNQHDDRWLLTKLHHHNFPSHIQGSHYVVLRRQIDQFIPAMTRSSKNAEEHADISPWRYQHITPGNPLQSASMHRKAWTFDRIVRCQTLSQIVYSRCSRF